MYLKIQKRIQMYDSVMKRLKVFYLKYIFENLYTQDYQNSKQESTVYLLLSALRCTQYDHLHLKCYLQVNRLFFFKTFKYSYYCRNWLSRKITNIRVCLPLPRRFKVAFSGFACIWSAFFFAYSKAQLHNIASFWWLQSGILLPAVTHKYNSYNIIIKLKAL